MKPQQCSNCKHLIVPLDSAGRRRVLGNGAYVCGFVVVMPAMPDSIAKSHWYRTPDTMRRHMCPDEGGDCPTWEPRPAGAVPRAMPEVPK